MKLSCPAGTAGCTGSVSLFSTKTIKVGQLKAQLLLGRKSFSLKAGETKTIKVKLASGTAKLAKKKKLATSDWPHSIVAMPRRTCVRGRFPR